MTEFCCNVSTDFTSKTRIEKKKGKENFPSFLLPKVAP